MTRLPLLLVGDGPAEPTGLGRIARDLAAQIVTSDLPVDLVQIGGGTPPCWTGWRHYPLDRSDDWGARHVDHYYRDLFGDRPGILWVIWDPGRLLPYAQLDLPVQRWTYTAIDAANVAGRITGPAGAALKAFDRVLAYGRWGSRVLHNSLDADVAYLPHGISPVPIEEDRAWVNALLGRYCHPDQIVVGAVMTNQWRKDFGIYFQTLHGLRQRGYKVFGWLHTDVAVKAWAVQQLVDDFGLQKAVCITIADYTDTQLAALYRRCALTLLPSGGEGFGYPIVESLAAGVPVVHGDCAGGAELVPKTEWRVPVRGWRIEGIYALERPVWHAEDWINAAERVLRWRQAVGDTVVQAYCRGAVAHLDWRSLWPRWRGWIRQGLQAT